MRPFLLCLLFLFALPGTRGHADTLASFLPGLDPASLSEGADGFGAVRDDVPVAPVLRDGETVAWAFLTSDFVGTTGYSGKPIHVVAAVSPDAVLTGVQLVKHSEPIVLVGIPNARMLALTEAYSGLDLKAEATAGGSAHDLDIISGATVTVMVIDDSIVRAGLKVSRALGLGGLAPQVAAGPPRELDLSITDPRDWMTLSGDGSIRRMTLDVGQINAAFEATGDARAIARPAPGDASFDLDGDGVAETPYRPNDAMDLVLWTQPAAKLLMGSPAVQLVRWSQSAFPALLPGGVIDSYPLVRPVDIPVPERAVP